MPDTNEDEAEDKDREIFDGRLMWRFYLYQFVSARMRYEKDGRTRKGLWPIILADWNREHPAHEATREELQAEWQLAREDANVALNIRLMAFVDFAMSPEMRGYTPEEKCKAFFEAEATRDTSTAAVLE